MNSENLPTSTPPASSDGQVSILLVDDNRANRLALRVILENLGHELVEVASGEEALQQLQSREFAVVLLDVLMALFSAWLSDTQPPLTTKITAAPLAFSLG